MVMVVWCGRWSWLCGVGDGHGCVVWEMVTVVWCGRWSWLCGVGDGHGCVVWEMVMVVWCGRWSWLCGVGDGHGCVVWEMVMVVWCGRWSWLCGVGDGHGCVVWEMVTVVWCGRWSWLCGVGDGHGCVGYVVRAGLERAQWGTGVPSSPTRHTCATRADGCLPRHAMAHFISNPPFPHTPHPTPDMMAGLEKILRNEGKLLFVGNHTIFGIYDMCVGLRGVGRNRGRRGEGEMEGGRLPVWCSNEGKLLLVGNHTIFAHASITPSPPIPRLTPSRRPLLIRDIHMRTGVTLRGLGAPTHWQGPFADQFTKYGAVRVRWGGGNGGGDSDGTDAVPESGMEVSPRACYQLLREGENLLLYPGGGREVGKRKNEKYKLFWRDTTDFVRIAVRCGATIVPFSTIGVEDAFDVLMDPETLLMCSWTPSEWTEGLGKHHFGCARGEKYKLFWRDTTDLVRIAVRCGATVVPFSTIEVEDAFDVLVDPEEIMSSPIGPWLKLALQATGMHTAPFPLASNPSLLKIPFTTPLHAFPPPISPNREIMNSPIGPWLKPALQATGMQSPPFPLASNAGLLPRPQRLYFLFSDPIRTDGLDPSIIRNKEECNRIYQVGCPGVYLKKERNVAMCAACCLSSPQRLYFLFSDPFCTGGLDPSITRDPIPIFSSLIPPPYQQTVRGRVEGGIEQVKEIRWADPPAIARGLVEGGIEQLKEMRRADPLRETLPRIAVNLLDGWDGT
ncbi:unnamed protein product [Closterium sp. Yama58-4]|nr:unnamed protein product [Closterium sp. Yama58-4]